MHFHQYHGCMFSLGHQAKDSPPLGPVVVRAISSPYKITEIPGKGLGFVATRPLKRGERILTDAPLIRTRLHDEDHVSVARFERLPAQTQNQILALANICKQGHPITGIVWTNSIPLTYKGKEAGLFPLASRINHSCAPNTMNSWDEGSEQLRTHAIRDIQEAEEITSYYPCSLAEYWPRQNHLESFHGFRCACRLCLLPLAEREASNQRIARINLLEKGLERVWRDSCSTQRRPTNAHIKLVGMLLDLYREEGVVDWRPMQALSRGSRLAIQMESYRRATIFAERAYKMSIELRGHDHTETRKMAMNLAAMKQCLDKCGGYGITERRSAEKMGVDMDNWLFNRDGPEISLWV